MIPNNAGAKSQGQPLDMVVSGGAQGSSTGNHGSTLSNKKGSQSHGIATSTTANNNGSSQLGGGDDSKLGRKGERPTVAQILEIGVSSTG